LYKPKKPGIFEAGIKNWIAVISGIEGHWRDT